jgi:GntR family transcriptional regulator
MYIDKKSPIPAYYQLKSIILEKIQNGEFSRGNLIPSERELGENLNISRMTVRQALNQLVAEGVLYREKGKGTFVSKAKIEQHNIMSFSETVKKKGLIPSTAILNMEKIMGRPDMKEILEINKDEYLYNIKRLRFADDMPIAIEEIFIPERYCPGLERFDLKSSFYKLIKEEYSYMIHHIDNIIEATKPSKEERKLLNISETIPVLRIIGVSCMETGTKLFYERDIYRSDEYQYNVRIFMNKEK